MVLTTLPGLPYSPYPVGVKCCIIFTEYGLFYQSVCSILVYGLTTLPENLPLVCLQYDLLIRFDIGISFAKNGDSNAESTCRF